MQIVGQAKKIRLKEGLTCSFKGISREKKASWGNRFVRDHNDLVYDADSQSISKKLKSANKPQKKPINDQETGLQAKKYEYSPFKQRQLVKTSQSSRNLNQGLSPFQYLKDLQQYETKTRAGVQSAASSSRRIQYNPQVIAFNQNGFDREYEENANYLQKNQKNSQNCLGLSQFQYQKTIEGKIKSRRNHHIDFQMSKTGKIDNTNKVWYDNQKDIKKSQSQLQKQKQNNLIRIHPFKSYSSHKLFFRTKRMSEDNACGYGGLLDKIYETTPQAYEITREKVIKDVVDYKTMTIHPALFKKIGTGLDYEVQKINTMGIGNEKKPILQLSKTQKNLTFSRQVINPTRGCYR